MKKNVVFVSIALVFFASCGNYTAWQYNISEYNIEFKKLRYSLDDQGKTQTVIGYLKSDTTIFGYPCQENWIHFTNEWQLELFCLSENFSISDNNFRKGSWIRIKHNKGLICVFPEDTIVQGHYCRGGGGVKGVQTSFYANGKLKSFFSNENTKIDGVLCKKGLLSSIILYQNGLLKECNLAETQTVNGKEYKKRSRLSFDLEGNAILKK
ncbi:MAG: hypothetical protein HN704_08755 [Bacteroidetes bacterium]|jgi:hypothetical protein|nr:hypothetical protein [Bacteroidota bacterium]MBT6687503.1 hypothetical protein [Bacteroidota bacterium]MBT7142991.1 hypothetical protein [Bacteroidota bacterium]MBT7491681.1 hypothetical protein [Bacteroidota bacterium]